MKSAIAGAVSFSLFVSSAGWPASRAFAQAVSAARAGEGSSPVRALSAAAAAGLSPLSALASVSGSLSASAPAASAPSAARASAA
ncbi:MAG: hypothetical protein HY925_03505, partial [Elusimicrobia bacterium]|nr:hypothetical protein [Elusimicrobiota bacterium]